MVSRKVKTFLLFLYFQLNICYSVKVIQNDLLEIKQFNTHPNINKGELNNLEESNPLDVAEAYIRDVLGFTSYKLLSNYESHGDVAHLTFQQMVEDFEVFNSFINFNVQIDNGNILSYGSSFAQVNKTPIEDLAHAKLKVDRQKIKQGLSTIVKFNRLKLSENELENIVLSLKLDDEGFTYINQKEDGILEIKVSRKGGWYQLDSGKLKFTFEFNIWLADGEYFSSKLALSETFVIIEQLDLVDNFIPKYMVQSLDQNSISHYQRSLISDPSDKLASSFGWHTDSMSTYLKTEGNNVRVGLSDVVRLSDPDDNSHLAYARSDDQFNFSYKHESLDDAIVNVFYVTNMMHDILYNYGFNEQAGNFQKVNKDPKLGKAGDPIIALVRSGVKKRSPSFHSAIDGKSPVMYLPARLHKDGTIRYSGLDNSVIIHELGHGLSSRLTGGPKTIKCLSGFESAGMNEGWSDALAYIIQTKAANKRTDMITKSSYFHNKSEGNRNYPYTSDQKKNPLMYSKLKANPRLHMRGEVWASILHEVYWNLIDHLGFSSNLMSISNPHNEFKGNALMLKLMIMGMKLQPCNPKFIEARDAFIQAERQLTKGDYHCLIWDGFAKRGLGFSANKAGLYSDSFDLPPACLNKKTTKINFEESEDEKPQVQDQDQNNATLNTKPHSFSLSLKNVTASSVTLISILNLLIVANLQ